MCLKPDGASSPATAKTPCYNSEFDKYVRYAKSVCGCTKLAEAAFFVASLLAAVVSNIYSFIKEPITIESV